MQDDGTISVDQQIVLNKWMRSFKKLLNTDNGNSLIPTDGGPSEITADTSTLNADITVKEVRYAIYDAGKGKATGYDGIPLEVLQNATCIY